MHFSFTLHSRRAGKGVMGGRGAESGSRSSPSHAPIRHAGSSGIGDNDVTMLLHVTADHTSATVVSFPRDLVSIPLCGKSISSTMLNSTLSRGLSCTVQTIEKMTGLTIPYAGVITFDGVTGMSNAVGGVAAWRCVSRPQSRIPIPTRNSTSQPDSRLPSVLPRSHT